MIGNALGPYRIDRELGAGGMGKVYAATVAGHAPGLAEGTRIALKVVHPNLLETPGFFKRFLREAEIGKSVVHENVVRTYDCDQLIVGGVNNSFLVMEYVEGQNLRELLRELDKVPEELCRHIGSEIAKGLAAIHSERIVHRDLKPENVLITADHVVKVMDLGVARLADESLRLSQSGAFVGSVEYAAPEQFTGRPVGASADLHALGLILYELASAQHPYRADDFRGVMHRVCNEPPRRLGDVNPQLSPFFEEAVHTLLAKAPEDRFADAGALLAVLEEGEKSAWWRARAKEIRAETKRPLRRIRIPRETAVYGREAELTKLASAFAKAKSGEGQVVLIEGEAGIGKSRLVDELIGRVQRDGEDLNFLFGSYPPGGAASAAGAFSTAFREQFGEAGVAPYLPQTPLLVPAFEALLSGDAAPSGCEALTKDSIATCFVQAIRSLAAERTTVLLIDDLHFAQEESRALFTSLATAAPGHRVLLVGTTRPGGDEKWLAGLTRLPQTTQLTLGRLGPKDLAELLRDSFKSEALAHALGVQVGLKSDGNPFFAFEIIRGLREGQFITQKDDGTWVSTRVIDDIQIPSSVLDLVNARVADLSEEERDLLDVACCWGFEFDPLLVGEVLGVARIPLLKRLGQIERQHRLVRAAGVLYAFDHHQVQEALYGSLSELLRREYHAALASTLETRSGAAVGKPQDLDGALCVDLCEHFLKGAQGERALRYLEPTQSHLERGYLHAQVAALTERALAVPGLLAGAQRVRTLLKLTGALDAMGRRAREGECAREAEGLAGEIGDDELRGKAALALGRCLFHAARYAEAEAAQRRALEIALARGDRMTEAWAMGQLGNSYQFQSRLAEAKEHHERQLEICSEIGHREGEATATLNLGSLFWSQGRLAEAEERYARCLALVRAIGNRQSEARAEGSLGLVCTSLGRLTEAMEHIERATALARETGDRSGEVTACGNLANVYRQLGRLAEAIELHVRTLALSRETGKRQSEAIALVNLGPEWLVLGDRTRASDALHQSLTMCREIGARYPEGYALAGLGRVADEQGDVADALSWAEESLALRREIGHGDGVAESLAQLGDLQRRAGDVEGARAALEESLSLSQEQGRGMGVALALALLANLPGGDARSAEAALAESTESVDSMEPRFLLWTATGDRAHLTEAKRLLDIQIDHAPPECRDAMRTNVRLHREILAACDAPGIA